MLILQISQTVITQLQHQITGLNATQILLWHNDAVCAVIRSIEADVGLLSMSEVKEVNVAAPFLLDVVTAHRRWEHSVERVWSDQLPELCDFLWIQRHHRPPSYKNTITGFMSGKKLVCQLHRHTRHTHTNGQNRTQTHSQKKSVRKKLLIFVTVTELHLKHSGQPWVLYTQW